MPQLSPGNGLMTLTLILLMMVFLFTLLPFKPTSVKTAKSKSNLNFFSALIYK